MNQQTGPYIPPTAARIAVDELQSKICVAGDCVVDTLYDLRCMKMVALRAQYRYDTLDMPFSAIVTQNGDLITISQYHNGNSTSCTYGMHMKFIDQMTKTPN